MAVRHIVTIQAAPGRAADLARAFHALAATVRGEEGCEQYELLHSLDDPDRLVILERWASRELLDRHMTAERSRDDGLVQALIDLWAPGVVPTVERFEE